MTHDEVKNVLAGGRKNIIINHEMDLDSEKARLGDNFHTDAYGIEYETEYRKMLDSGMSIRDFQDMVGGSDFVSMQLGNRALDYLKTGKVDINEVRACFNPEFTFDQKWEAVRFLRLQTQSEHPYQGSLTDLLKPEYTETELSLFADAIYNDKDFMNVINGIKAEAEIKASYVYSPEQRQMLTAHHPLRDPNMGDERKILIVADPDRSPSWIDNMIMHFGSGLTVEQAEKYSGPEFDDKKSEMLCFCVSGSHPMHEDMVDTIAGLDMSAGQISAVWEAYDKYNGRQKEFIGYTRMTKDDIDMLIDRNLSSEQIKRLTGLLSNIADSTDRQVIYELAASGLPDDIWNDTADKIGRNERYKNTVNMIGRNEDKLAGYKEEYKDIPKRDLTQDQRFNLKNTQKSIDFEKKELRELKSRYPDADRPVAVPSAEKFADKEPERGSLCENFAGKLESAKHHNHTSPERSSGRTEDVLS